ncbi:ileal sodium/bile acid cotransporter-like [Centruroides vittatus]|uniref:ileal sodium/bile acid cotransporter-like n=1 Tax=Centruroides vittatus TaxID=120091 RepID=UPI00350F350B
MINETEDQSNLITNLTNYTHINEDIKTAYNVLVIFLVIFIMTSMGANISWKQGGIASGFIFLIIVTMLKFAMFKNSLHQISWKLTIASICMPITGIILGYFIAFICRRSNAVCKTIAIESGIQNVAVAFSVIVLSFDIRKYFTILFIPWFYGLSQGVICALLCLFYHILIKYCKRVQSTQETVESVRKKEDIVMKPLSTIPT